ncbi:MAG TPA: response regulator [bacterium]|nr:response regulator [bacterium]
MKPEAIIDAVLLDYHMRGMDGLQTLEEIRKNDEGLPVIIITAYELDEKTVEQMKKMGVYKILYKPIAMETVTDLIVEVRKAVLFLKRLGQDDRIPINVLIVDDDPGITKTLGVVLEDQGFRVTATESGREALAVLNSGTL